MKNKVNKCVNGVGGCVGIILIIVLAVLIIWFGFVPMMLLGMVVNSALLMIMAALVMLAALALAIWLVIRLTKD